MKTELTLTELEKAQENEGISLFIREIIAILLSAINDWPSKTTNLADFDMEISHFLKNEVTKSNIEKKLLHINYTKNAWEAESLSNLQEIFSSHFENKSFKEIILELGFEIKSNEKPKS
ncbi:hypothetical protein [Pedobacter sp.]|uniref:hypothetical protein n=1 Tax=Pedobacter sp. TaxID=1411316 RepID=UPI00396CB256